MRRWLLELELRRWRRAGRQARLWWRDDDARAPGPELDRLLACAAGAPLTMAVIPQGSDPALAQRLASAAGVTVVQHGVDHENRRTGPAAGEFAHDRPLAEVRQRLASGWAILAILPGAAKVFVPPWNDVHPLLAAALSDEGYAGWSAWGEMRPQGHPARQDAHLDLMRWKGGARFRGEGKFFAEFTALLAVRRRAAAWEAPIGLLTHHLAHDEAAWSFLAGFVDWTRTRPELAWRSLPELLAPAG